MSPAQFKDHYENKHVPLIRSLTGDHFPQSHSRHYIARMAAMGATTDNTNETHPAVALVGTQADFDYDALAILTWDTEEVYEKFIKTIGGAEVAAKIAADEEKFLDRGKLKVAGLK